jgi:(R,R)-butanediol dehydrogenase/meso-butanediol dehydrogenase/diacetyl reductase
MTVYERRFESRSSVLIEAGRFELRKESVCPPSTTQALVRVTYTGICGSDFPIVDGLHPRAAMPLVLGHEITGVIESSGGSTLPAGTPVAVNPLIACLKCTACSQGFFHVCKNLKIMGIDTAGSLSELLAVPIYNLYPFSAHIDPVQAAFAEPLAVAIHAVRRSRLTRAERVLIFGAGPIGILVGLVAKHMGILPCRPS